MVLDYMLLFSSNLQQHTIAVLAQTKLTHSTDSEQTTQ